MAFRALSVALLFGAAGASELTTSTWDEKVAGKSVFIKFQAPWWGHCKSMKPAWDKLMGEYADSTSVLIGDVDCTDSGKDLCEKHGVEGFPTIKYGDPDDMKAYEGGRSYEDLKKHAEENLGPQCGPGANIGLCSEKVKAKIEKYMKMTAAELQAKIDKALEKANVDVPLMNKAKGYVAKLEAGGGKEEKTDL